MSDWKPSGEFVRIGDFELIVEPHPHRTCQAAIRYSHMCKATREFSSRADAREWCERTAGVLILAECVTLNIQGRGNVEYDDEVAFAKRHAAALLACISPTLQLAGKCIQAMLNGEDVGAIVAAAREWEEKEG